MKSHRNDAFFRQLILSYLMVILFSLVTTLIVYSNAMEDLKERTEEEAREKLKTQVSLIDARLRELESIAQKMSLEPDVIRLMGIPSHYDTAESYQFRKLYNSISLYPISNDFIHQFYLYFLKSNTLISSDTIALKVPFYYKNNLAYQGMDYDAWRLKMESTRFNRDFWPTAKLADTQIPFETITYLQSIPLGRYTSSKAVVFALIKKESLYSYLKALPFLTDDSLIVISGSEETPVASWEPAETSGASIAVVEYVSPFTSWLYRIEYPREGTFDKINQFRNIFLLSELFLLALGVALTVYSAYRNSRPYYQMASELEEMKSRHRQSFYEGLISGRFPSEEKLKEQMAISRYRFSGDSYRIALLTFSLLHNGEEKALLEITQAFSRIRELGEEDLLYHHKAGDSQIILILRDPNRRESFWGDLEAHLLKYVDRDGRGREREWEMHLLLGQTYGNLLNTSLYYGELTYILEYAPPERFRLVNDRDDFIHESPGCYYPLNQEQRLIHLSRDGNVSQVEDILDHIFTNNFSADLSTGDMEELEREMTGTLYRLLRQEDWPEEERRIIEDGIEALRENKQISCFRKELEEIYLAFCLCRQRRKIEEGSELVRRTEALVERFYGDPAFCLTEAADRLNLTGKYLSHTYKSVTGENFSIHLEQVRMEKARQLLTETDTKVVDIPALVGYANNNTFYKAFKRFYGLNPSSFR